MKGKASRFGWWKFEEEDEEQASLDSLMVPVEKGLGKRGKMKRALRLIAKRWDRPGRSISEQDSVVLCKLRELSLLDECLIEAELIKLNAPPCLGQKIPADRSVRLCVMYVLFQLSLPFTERFRTLVIRGAWPNPLTWLLPYATRIQSDSLPEDTPLHELVAFGNSDFVHRRFRALYALKIARWIPEWPTLRTPIPGGNAAGESYQANGSDAVGG